MSYATLAEFKSAIGIGTADTTDDTALQSVLDATDALIDLNGVHRSLHIPTLKVNEDASRNSVCFHRCGPAVIRRGERRVCECKRRH